MTYNLKGGQNDCFLSILFIFSKNKKSVLQMSPYVLETEIATLYVAFFSTYNLQVSVIQGRIQRGVPP